jgi:Amt family ammonium transporter
MRGIAGRIIAATALLFGAAAAFVCYGAIQLVKVRLKLDDSLDVFAVHGVGGMMGSILLAIFLAAGIGGTGYAEGMNMGSMLGVQVLAVAAVAVYSAVATTLIALGVSLFLPMRVSEDEERQGLDIANHGERGWEFD